MRFECELTDRQREILVLIERGHTNGEIAEELSVPVTAVKWHVSELLGKLGFASREEAAEYWRWRSRPDRRLRLRAASLFGLLFQKPLAVAGSIVAASAVGAAVLLFPGVQPENPAIVPDLSGQPFYLEATHTTVQPGPGTVETVTEPDTDDLKMLQRILEIDRPGVPFSVRRNKNDGPPIVRTSPVRWWFADPEHWHFEHDVTSGFSRRTNADGTWITSYPIGPDSYRKTELGKYTQRLDNGYTELGLLGPTRAPDVPQLLAALDGASIVGYEEVLGRNCAIIQLGPQGMDVGPNGTTYRGSGRLWLDEERMVVMRSERILGNGYEYHDVVTRLDWGYAPTAGELAFQPPPGATELQAPAALAAPPPGTVVEVER